MHEIGIVRSMCRTVLDYMEENNVAAISEIVCEVGELSLVIPQYVEELFPPVAEGTPLEGAKLILDWHDEQMLRSDSQIDPLWTVIHEGGPYHASDKVLPAYLKRLEATGRAAGAEELRRRHPVRRRYRRRPSGSAPVSAPAAAPPVCLWSSYPFSFLVPVRSV